MSNTLGTKRLGTVLALIVAFAIALAMIVTPAAHAQPAGDSGGQGSESAGEARGAGNIDPDAEGSLIIHKHAGPGTGTQDDADGTVKNPPPAGATLSGATFHVVKINGIDLTNADDWAKVKQLQFDGTNLSGVQGASLGDAETNQTTNGEGVATFNNLAVGVYLVQETGLPEKVSTPVKPFFVTIPFPHHPGSGTDNNGWLYNVNVYPKNEVKGELAKELDDSGDNLPATVGSDLHWKLTVPVPSTVNAIVAFDVTDTLQNGTSLSTKNDVTATLDGTALVKDTDFTVITDGTDPQVVTIRFKAAGLNKLNVNYGKNIVIDLPATVNKALGNAGDLKNKVINNNFHRIFRLAKKPFEPGTPITTDPGDPGDPGEDPNYPPTPGKPTDDPYVPPTDGSGDPVPPTAYFGDYKLKKVAKNTDIPLGGATFQVYAANAAGDAINETKAIGAPVTSGSDGIINIQDLYIGKEAGQSRVYFVKETAAPAGYKLNDTPLKITVSDTTGADTQDAKFDNEPYGKGDMPDLPLTGASGKLLMTLGGAAIVLFAAGTVLVTRRRKA